MNFTNKFVIRCAVISVWMSCSAWFSVEANNLQDDDSGACLVQYLQKKEKLSADFRSNMRVSSKCRLVTPLTIEIIEEGVHNLFKKKIPNAADCLTEEFDDKETIDLVIKSSLLDISSSLSDSERQTQVEETRNQIKQDLIDIARHCQIGDESLNNVFADILGIKNTSLEVVQYEYCLAKYALDNELLEFGNVETNPQHIDPNSVDCDRIMEADKRENEKELIDKASDTFMGEGQMSCVVNSYKSGKIYDLGVALKVVRKLNFPREKQQVEMNRMGDKIGEFAVSIYDCLD